jgi:hypothetical protein
LDTMTVSMITQALEETRARISSAQHQLAEAERTVKAAQEEERLLLRLLALREGAAPAEHGLMLPGQNSQGSEHAVEPKRAENSKHPAVQAVVRELATAGRPLHISDLMRLLSEAHVQVPGAGTQANLITHLRRDPRLVRPSRGMYGLSEWGLENMPATRERKRRRKRVRSAASTKENET